ncbi:MAG: cupin domain-containing protein [Micromonospora sp.]
MKTTSYGRQALDTVMTMRPTDVDAVPWQPVPGCPGVLAKDLWRSGDLHDALISYEPGAGTPGHPHAGAHHHIWVVSGSASIAGRHVTAGSYIHVPPGVAHPVADVGEMGCLLLQMHRPLPVDAA